MGITIDCRPIKTEVKHLFGGVVRAMVSTGGSIMASLENVNGILAVNTPPDGLIHTDFEQEGVVPEVASDDLCDALSVLYLTSAHLRITMVLLPSSFLEPLYPCIMEKINDQEIELMIPPTPTRDTKPPIGSPIALSPSSSVGSSSLVRSTTPPLDYPFDESIFAELDNSLWIIPRALGSEPVPTKPNEMAPNGTSTFTAPFMNHAAIRKLVADSVATALEA
uniref:Uncharacterized protein n=1 Tax=Tanacetum cinerariifolium TaxID=118510 RepID=A0A699GYG3_TANCI|nr:hypothetical protein [Tanacetum cinerariifolium]